MKSLNVVFQQDSIALQFFDYFYAYEQSLQSTNHYKSRVEIKFNQPITRNYINILLIDFEHCFKYRDCSQYDYIFIDNRAESLETSSYMVLATMEENPRAYLLCGSQVHETHPWYDRILSYNTDLYLLRDCITRPFYPQHWHDASNLHRSGTMCFINGQNRAWRRFFIALLTEAVPDLKIRSRISAYSNHSTKLRDCAFESDHDQTFKTWLNANISSIDCDQQEKTDYYANSIPLGIDQKFGFMPPGYFWLDEYFQYKCIIYPEAAWINHQLFMTEKTFKCFAAKTIPWPIGGSHCHTMMNALGFGTARDLLPDELKKFDCMEDHHERYKAQSAAIAWANAHPEIWDSPAAAQIRSENFQKFYQNHVNLNSLTKMQDLIKAIQ